MTIATDREGETIAFGVTTPIITPATTAEDVADYCGTIARKMIAQCPDTSDPYVLTIPIPVHPTDTSTYFDLQETALQAALQMSRSLHVNCYTVVNCTPVAFYDTTDTLATGYVVTATYTPDVPKLMAEQSEHPMPLLWTGYAKNLYGQAAIDAMMRTVETQWAKIHGAPSDGDSEDTDSIH